MPQIVTDTLINPNPFYKIAVYDFNSICTSYINKYPQKSKYIILEPEYNNVDLEKNFFDPVDFFSSDLIEKLKSKNLKIIFDCSVEGSHKLFPYFNRFKKGFERKDLSLKNFYYLTGDPSEKDVHNDVNVFHINSLDSIVTKNLKLTDQIKTLNFYFTCLNRKPRFWRSLLLYRLLTDLELKGKILASHPKIDKNSLFLNCDDKTLNSQMVEFYIEHSPIQASNNEPLNDKMDFSHVISPLSEIYTQAIFDVTMETYQENNNGYITEKTFKAMLNGLPILIWGTPGINTVGLKKLGFKTYEDWFDLSFDLEQNTQKRLELLILEIKRVCKIFENLNFQEKLQWQKQNFQIIEHNKNLILNLLPSNKSEFNRLVDSLEQY